MSAYGDRLRAAYERANLARQKRGMPKLRKGQYMMQSYPNIYKNEASARRQFNKVASGETSGVRMQKRSRPRAVDYIRSGRSKGMRIGGGMIGLWMINVTFWYEDENGDWQQAERSFIAQSMQYTNVEDIPYIEAAMIPIAEEHIKYWIQHDSPPSNNYYLDHIEVEAIRRSSITEEEEKMGKAVVVDQETYAGYRLPPTWGTPGQRMVTLDNLEIE